jgi:hypothetical protein
VNCIAKYTSPAADVKSSELKACFDAYGQLSCADFVRFNNEPNPPEPAACDVPLHGNAGFAFLRVRDGSFR